MSNDLLLERWFALANKIKLNNAYSNIDIYYGTYTSLQEARESVPTEIRKKGLTVGIEDEHGSIKEYWWRDGITNIDLVPKQGSFIKFGYGEKATGVDAGEEFEFSITDDYLFICVTPGEIGEAIWKKIVLFHT